MYVRGRQRLLMYLQSAKQKLLFIDSQLTIVLIADTRSSTREAAAISVVSPPSDERASVYETVTSCETNRAQRFMKFDRQTNTIAVENVDSLKCCAIIVR